MKAPKTYNDIAAQWNQATFVSGIYDTSQGRYIVSFYFDDKDKGTRKGYEVTIGSDKCRAWYCSEWNAEKSRYEYHKELNDIILESKKGMKALKLKIAEFCREKYFVPNPFHFDTSNF